MSETMILKFEPTTKDSTTKSSGPDQIKDAVKNATKDSLNEGAKEAVIQAIEAEGLRGSAEANLRDAATKEAARDVAKRGRPKGRSTDKRSFGPLGDLIRSHRIARNLGLLDVAKACKCSVQFISNIEHGRAPLPWDKTEQLARFLGIAVEELQAANLAVRSDFRSFVKSSTAAGKKSAKAGTLGIPFKDAASLLALTAQDPQLRELLERYQAAPVAARKKFYQQGKAALGA